MAAARKALPKERGIYVRETREGTRYEFIYQDSTGRTRWSTCSTLKEARQGRAAKVAALARGERVALSRVTLGEYAAEWLGQQEGRLRPETIDRYSTDLRLHVLPKLGRRKLASLDVEDVASLLADLRAKGLAAWTPAGTPLGVRNIVRRGLEPALAKTGLPKIRWHDLRHCCASALIEQGATPAYVARVLGHTDASITLRVYAHEFERAEGEERHAESAWLRVSGVSAVPGLHGSCPLGAPGNPCRPYHVRRLNIRCPECHDGESSHESAIPLYSDEATDGCRKSLYGRGCLSDSGRRCHVDLGG
jgi:Phage integrase family/Phage integrase, N-terminal SAM-like domain